MENEVRSAARLIVVDSDRRVLLFLHADGHGREFWATPGGGVEPGETTEQAAHREAVEELGATDFELRRLWSGHSEFLYANRRVSQAETFFLFTQNSAFLGPDVAEIHNKEGIVKIRWWSVQEIENSREPIFPADLSRRLKEHRLVHHTK